MRYRFHLAFLVAGLIMAGCASQQSAVVATVDGEKITLDEFNKQFEKNNGGKDASHKATIEDREKFLDLYTIFRMKVLDAYAHGYQNDPDVQGELQQYSKDLAVTYLIANEITDPAIHRMYDKQLFELRASHILIKMPPNAIPPDTLRAYEKAMKIIDSLKSGRSFEELALNNSEDPSVKNNKGDLYFFTAGSIVPEFENAAFSVPPGTVVPYPVRTQYGYHVIKVTARDANPGAIRVSHIMKRLTPGSTPQDSAKAWEEMEMVLDSLAHGVNFADLAREYSDDTFSKHNGGDLGFITRRRTIKEFDEAAFKLKPGEHSGIIKSPYGLHIIEVTDAKPVGSFESMEQELKTSYQRSGFQADYDRYVDSLKKAYRFLESPEAVSAWYNSVDSTKTTGDSNWDSSFSAMTRAKEIFSFAGQKISIDSVIHLTKLESELQGLPFSNRFSSEKIFDKISKKLVMEYKAVSMESTFPNFAETIEEYKEGSMLFKAEQKAVWDKISINDSTMHIYFDANRSAYTWPNRVDLQEIFVPNDSVAQVVTFLLKKQHLPFDSVAAQFNTRPTTKAKNGEWGLLPDSTNALTEKAWTLNEGDVSEFFPYEHGFSIIKVLSKEPAREKTFAEAGSELSSAFQEYESKLLENEWENSLRKKYPVTLYKEVLMTSQESTLNK